MVGVCLKLHALILLYNLLGSSILHFWILLTFILEGVKIRLPRVVMFTAVNGHFVRSIV